jgi:uncharacterized protein YqeY
MPTRADLENALKDAMRSGNDLRKSTIRMALAAVKNAEIDKGGALDENGIAAILQKEIKSRRESIADAEKAHRPELAEVSQAEIAILEGFLPKALSAEELDALARQAVAEVGATGIREMGQVMKVLIPRLQGRASGDQASQAVRKLLQ